MSTLGSVRGKEVCVFWKPVGYRRENTSKQNTVTSLYLSAVLVLWRSEKGLGTGRVFMWHVLSSDQRVTVLPGC